MNLKQHFELLSHYNQKMNDAVYSTTAKLDDAALREDRGAFFGSVLGTLNHIMVGDRVWLKRFAQHSANFHALEPVRTLETPKALNQILCDEFFELQNARQQLDTVIIEFCRELHVDDLNSTLIYASMTGEQHKMNVGLVLQHFFNHQTHHRGQITTLLSQSGLDVGVTDFIRLVPEQ